MSFEIEKGEENMNDFPWYGLYKYSYETTSFVVLFTMNNTGVVVASNDENYKIGHFSKTWEKYNFTPLKSGDRLIIDVE